MAGRSGEKVKLASYDDLFQVDSLKEVTEIEITELHDYKNHPFKVLDNEQMEALKESIRQNGMLNPILVRKVKKGYEIVSGHRRKHAAELLGIEKIPAIIKDLSDDESTILMVDSNIQREEILPSERAFSLKMKMEALSHQGASRRHVEKLTCEEVGENSGISGRQVQRYIRLTFLLPELLAKVDQRDLQLMYAVDISYFNKEVQALIMEYLVHGNTLKTEQVSKMKLLLKEEMLTIKTATEVLYDLPEKKSTKNVTLSEKHLMDYFPPDYSKKDMEQLIYSLLEQWKTQKEGAHGYGSK